jgi:hypothetical protein
VLVQELAGEDRGQHPAFRLPAAQLREGAGGEDAVQDARGTDVPLYGRIQQPQPGIDGEDRREHDREPLAGGIVAGKRLP